MAFLAKKKYILTSIDEPPPFSAAKSKNLFARWVCPTPDADGTKIYNLIMEEFNFKIGVTFIMFFDMLFNFL